MLASHFLDRLILEAIQIAKAAESVVSSSKLCSHDREQICNVVYMTCDSLLISSMLCWITIPIWRLKLCWFINVELAVVAEPEGSDEIPIDCNEAGSNGGQPDHLGYCSTQF